MQVPLYPLARIANSQARHSRDPLLSADVMGRIGCFAVGILTAFRFGFPVSTKLFDISLLALNNPRKRLIIFIPKTLRSSSL